MNDITFAASRLAATSSLSSNGVSSFTLVSLECPAGRA